MKKSVGNVEKLLTEKVTGTRKKTNLIIGIVFGSLLVFGVFNMGYRVGEFLYYIMH